MKAETEQGIAISISRAAFLTNARLSSKEILFSPLVWAGQVVYLKTNWIACVPGLWAFAGVINI